MPLVHLTLHKDALPLDVQLRLVVDGLPEIIAGAISSITHPISADKIDIYPYILHPYARTKYDVAIDVFVSPNHELQANSSDRVQAIIDQVAPLLPANRSYCVEIHFVESEFGQGRT